MPSTPHDVLIVAMREQPALLDALVKKLTGVRLPRGLKPKDATARLADPAEVRLDLVYRKAQRRAIFSVLSEPMLALLREASMNPDKIPETPAARKTRLFLEEQGRKRGRAEGRAEGEAKGRQDALMMLLQARGLELSDEDKARIRACADTATLDGWIERGATATSVREVLGAKSSVTVARRSPAGRARGASRTRA